MSDLKKNLQRDQNLREQSVRFLESKIDVLESKVLIEQNEITGLKNHISHLEGRHSQILEELQLKEQELNILGFKKAEYLERINKWQRDVDAKVRELSLLNDKIKEKRIEASDHAYIGLNLEAAFNELRSKIDIAKNNLKNEEHPLDILNSLVKTIRDQEFDEVIVQRTFKEEKNNQLSGSLYLKGLTITKDELRDILKPILAKIKRTSMEIGLKTKVDNHQICSELRLDWKIIQIDYNHQIHGV